MSVAAVVTVATAAVRNAAVKGQQLLAWGKKGGRSRWQRLQQSVVAGELHAVFKHCTLFLKNHQARQKLHSQ